VFCEASSFHDDGDSCHVFWIMPPCSDAVRHQRFGEPCCLSLRGEDGGRKTPKVHDSNIFCCYYV